MEKTPENALLAMLPASIHQRLAPEVSIVSAAAGDVLFDPEDPIDELCFPLDLVVSLDQVVDDAVGAEEPSAGVALIGSEGFAGIEGIFGLERAINRVSVRKSGRFVRIPAVVAREEFARPGAFHVLLLRSTDSLFAQICGIAACERVHSIEQRLIRWLLMFDDRVFGADLELTQDVLSQLLHVRRVSITMAASLLQVTGLISYSRGTIMIKDRAGLEERSCKCYRAIKDRYDTAQRTD